MKVAILAGGVGSRIAGETELRPKSMVEIGGKPVLWHIMKYCAAFGYQDFVIALGWMGDAIKRYWIDYSSLSSENLTVSLRDGRFVSHESSADDWRIDLVETGHATETGGRIKRLRSYLGHDTFMLTWGDSVSDVDLDGLLRFHRANGKLCTVTVARPPARFGHLEVGEGGLISEFSEKPQTGEGWVNSAFFVCEPQVLEYIDGDDTSWEREPLARLAAERQLVAYRHDGFWQSMDTLRDKMLLDALWEQGAAPWKKWG